jgi:hypothetical protein
MAAAVASAHNHVLRRWLRGESTDPIGEVDEAMRQVISLFTPRTPRARGRRHDRHRVPGRPAAETVLPAIRHALQAETE